MLGLLSLAQTILANRIQHSSTNEVFVDSRSLLRDRFERSTAQHGATHSHTTRGLPGGWTALFRRPAKSLEEAEHLLTQQYTEHKQGVEHEKPLTWLAKKDFPGPKPWDESNEARITKYLEQTNARIYAINEQPPPPKTMPMSVPPMFDHLQESRANVAWLRGLNPRTIPEKGWIHTGIFDSYRIQQQAASGSPAVGSSGEGSTATTPGLASVSRFASAVAADEVNAAAQAKRQAFLRPFINSQLVTNPYV